MDEFPPNFYAHILSEIPNKEEQMKRAKQILRENIYSVLTDPKALYNHAFAFARPICGNKYKQNGIKFLIDHDKQICDEILEELRNRGFYCGYCNAGFYYTETCGHTDAIGIVKCGGYSNEDFGKVFKLFCGENGPFHCEDL